MNFTNLKSLVQHLLLTKPLLRDNDAKLIIEIWCHQKRTLKFNDFNFFEHHFINNSIANPETIRRIRQKLQQHHPELRGENYLKRINYQTAVKKELSMPEWKKGGTP